VIFGEDGLGREPDETAVLDPAALVGAAAIIGLEIAQGDLLRGGGQSLHIIVFDTESAVTVSLSGGGGRDPSQRCVVPSHHLISQTNSSPQRTLPSLCQAESAESLPPWVGSKSEA
jgi:hypothetical protein